MQPLFSVIIPTYNRAPFIEASVNSVLEQNFTDYELIVVDDGSTDNTQQLLQNKGLQYVYQENRERGAARNQGMKLAKGKYVVFLDSDDLWLPEHLASLKAAIDKHPEANFISPKFRHKKGEHIQDAPVSKLRAGWHGVELVLKGNPLNMNACVKRDNAALKHFEEDKRYSILEDWIFWVANLLNDRVLLLDNSTVLVQHHDDRSLEQDHRQIAKKRLLANNYLLAKLRLSSSQARTISAYSHYFAAIHYYLGQHRNEALSSLMSSIKRAGLRLNFIFLFVKVLLGRKLILKHKDA